MKIKKIIEFNLPLEKIYDDFYPKLDGQVFHYTSGANLISILKSHSIVPVAENVQCTSIHSHESMGRYLGAVCLFDLRNKPTEQIEKIRGWYNFLAPRFEDSSLVYFVLSPDFYNDVTTLADLSEELKGKAMYLPFIESWHKGQIPLEKVSTIYKVNISKKS